jgi:hypothetical protein
MAISAPNSFDVMGGVGTPQMFNAGFQVGNITAPTAGIGDMIRGVMAKAQGNQDQYAAQGMDIAGKTFAYDKTIGAKDRDALARKKAAQEMQAALPYGGAVIEDVPLPVGPDGKSTGTMRMTRTDKVSDEGVVVPGASYPYSGDILKSTIAGMIKPKGTGTNNTNTNQNAVSVEEYMAALAALQAQLDKDDAARRSESTVGIQDIVPGGI